MHDLRDETAVSLRPDAPVRVVSRRAGEVRFDRMLLQRRRRDELCRCLRSPRLVRVPESRVRMLGRPSSREGGDGRTVTDTCTDPVARHDIDAVGVLEHVELGPLALLLR